MIYYLFFYSTSTTFFPSSFHLFFGKECFLCCCFLLLLLKDENELLDGNLRNKLRFWMDTYDISVEYTIFPLAWKDILAAFSSTELKLASEREEA